MPLSDDELLNFDHSTIPMFDPVRAEQLLYEHRDAYRPQLVAARFLTDWADRGHEEHGRDERWAAGWDFAMRDIAAHLRQGDFLPGGFWHDEADGLAGEVAE